MGQINMGRVILGGLVAGVVINAFELVLNLFVLADQAAAAMKALGKTADYTINQIATFVALGFVIGILTVWLYAAIRPRFGAGPKTGVLAGVTVWFAATLLPNIFLTVGGLFPVGFILTGTAVGLVEMAVAGAVGAALYQEDASATTRTATARA